MKTYERFLYAVLVGSAIAFVGLVYLFRSYVGANIDTVFTNENDWMYISQKNTTNEDVVADMSDFYDDYEFSTIDSVEVHKTINSVFLSYKVVGDDNLNEVKQEVETSLEQLVDEVKLQDHHVEFFVYQNVGSFGYNEDLYESKQKVMDDTNQLLFYGNVSDIETTVQFI